MRYGDGTRNHLRRLFLVDLLRCLASNWLVRLQEFRRLSPGHVKIFEHPVMATIASNVTPLSNRTSLPLRSLHLTPELDCVPDGSPPLDFIAEDLKMDMDTLRETVKEIERAHRKNASEKILQTNREESQAVKRLDILGSLFLPLSLSAGVHSMQTRLVNVYLVIWDFATLSIDLGCVAVFVIVLICFLNFAKAEETLSAARLTRIAFWTFGWLGIPLLLIGFNMGMFCSVQVGWKILAYGAAATGELAICFWMLAMVFLPLDAATVPEAVANRLTRIMR